ncbi:MAG: hypothetical protein HY649_04190 [Acidobacteria bacterium]|nr:hypothetical protein [Acidobacteriota bacterium]
MKQATTPFCFVAASYLIRIRAERARTLREMAQHLRAVSNESIFYHTFQSLESHHYTIYSNDFAQWTMSSCNQPALAEKLGAVDVRDFITIDDIRRTLIQILETCLEKSPHAADQPVFEPFYFCEAVEFVVPLETCAHNLDELAGGIRRMSLQTLHHHFINARLRTKLGADDFSNWIEDSLGLPALAKQLDRIDFYTNTLEQIREEILETLRRGTL